MKTLNQNGQSFIETMIVLPSLLVIVSGLLFLMYCLFVFEWIDHQTYQASLCLAKGSSQIQCRHQFLSTTHWMTPPNGLRIVQIHRSQQMATVSVKLDLGLIQKYFQSSLKLPIISQ